MWSGSPDQVVLSPWLHSLPAYFDHFALGMGLAVLVAWRPLPRWVPLAGIVVALVAFWVVSLRIGIGYELFEPYYALAVDGAAPALRRRSGARWSRRRWPRCRGGAWRAACSRAAPRVPRHDLLRHLPLAPDDDRRARAPRPAADLASVPVAGRAGARAHGAGVGGELVLVGAAAAAGGLAARGGGLLRRRQQPTSQQHSEQGEPGQLPVPVDARRGRRTPPAPPTPPGARARRAAAITPPKSAASAARPMIPSSAAVSRYSEWASRTDSSRSRCSSHSTRNEPVPIPLSGWSANVSAATRQ